MPEPDPEVPEDQNQDDDPNEDSDWADVTTDEANNEQQKAGPSAVSIYLEIGIIILIGSLIHT